MSADLKAARKVHDWTQAALAERSGVPLEFIREYERGDAALSEFQKSKIAMTLGKPISSLFLPNTYGEAPRVEQGGISDEPSPAEVLAAAEWQRLTAEVPNLWTCPSGAAGRE